MRRLFASLMLLLFLPLAALADIEAYFLDVGHGDAAIIIAEGEAMIVDGGEAQSSDKIFTVIKSLGVTELKYAVATHPHSDHVGGLASIFYAATVDAVFTPVLESANSRFVTLMEKAEQNNVPVIVPAIGDKLVLGGAMITVLSVADDCDDINDMSIVLRIDYGQTSFILCGDASTNVEKQMIASGADLDADVLKVGHHGSRSASSSEFLEAVSPQYAVISCASRYGLPDEDVLDALADVRASIVRTDVNGDITIISDGKRIVCASENITIASDGQKTESAPETYYIGNANSHVYHRITCNSVEKMKEKNKRILYTKEQAEELNYQPCKNCSP